MFLLSSPEQSKALRLKHTEMSMTHGLESNLNQQRTLKTINYVVKESAVVHYTHTAYHLKCEHY